MGGTTLKFGYYMARRYERDNDIIRSLNVDGGYTGMGPNIADGSGFNRLAEFETGLVSSMNQRTPVSGGDASLYFAMPEYAAFINDSWNATRKLTVNLGLRYDLPIPTYSVTNYWGVLDQTYPGWRFVMPGLTPGTKARPFTAPKKDFAPRIGLAYRLGDKTVIRSGYGIFYETGRFKFLDQVTWNSPGYGGSSYYAATWLNDPDGTVYTTRRLFPAAHFRGQGYVAISAGRRRRPDVDPRYRAILTPHRLSIRKPGPPPTSSAGVWTFNANWGKP